MATNPQQPAGRANDRPTPGLGIFPRPQGIEGNAALVAKGPITGGREPAGPYRHEPNTDALHAAASLHQQHGQYVGALTSLLSHTSLPSHSPTHGRTPALSDNPRITPEQAAAMRAGAMSGCQQCRDFGRGMNAMQAEMAHRDTERLGRERVRRANVQRATEAVHEAEVARLLAGPVAQANVQRLDQSGKNDGLPNSAIVHPVSGSAQSAGRGPATSGLGTVSSPIKDRPNGYNVASVSALDLQTPEQADGREEGDEDLKLDPDLFHEGGHSTEKDQAALAQAREEAKMRAMQPDRWIAEQATRSEREHQTSHGKAPPGG